MSSVFTRISCVYLDLFFYKRSVKQSESVMSHHLVDYTNDKSITEWVVPSTMLRINEKACYRYKNLKKITIHSGVSSIGFRAFKFCESLEEVVIPDSVIDIEDNAFESCINLKKIKLPSGLKVLKYGLFTGCYNLINITIPDSVTRIEPNAFCYCSRLKKIVLPNSVRDVGAQAFFACCRLESVEFPKSLLTMGDEVFDGCNKLVDVKLPNNLVDIPRGMFSNCESLQSLTIPSSVESIQINAFRGCKALTSITIPENVNYIDENAFISCLSLKEITFLCPISFDIFNMFYPMPSKIISRYPIENIPPEVKVIYENAYVEPKSQQTIRKGQKESMMTILNTLEKRGLPTEIAWAVLQQMKITDLYEPPITTQIEPSLGFRLYNAFFEKCSS